MSSRARNGGRGRRPDAARRGAAGGAAGTGARRAGRLLPGVRAGPPGPPPVARPGRRRLGPSGPPSGRRPRGSGRRRPGGSGPGSGRRGWLPAGPRRAAARPGRGRRTGRGGGGAAGPAGPRRGRPRSVTTSRPCQAASAIAVRAVTRSARMPSTSNARAHRGDLAQRGVRQADAGQPVAGRGDPAGQRRGRRRRSGRRSPPGRRRRPAGGAPPRPARPGRGWRATSHGQPEPVEQLRAQLALLRVHRADQQEPGGVPDRDAVALDVVHGPCAAASSSRSTRWSCSRLTSST